VPTKKITGGGGGGRGSSGSEPSLWELMAVESKKEKRKKGRHNPRCTWFLFLKPRKKKGFQHHQVKKEKNWFGVGWWEFFGGDLSKKENRSRGEAMEMDLLQKIYICRRTFAQTIFSDSKRGERASVSV